MYGGIGASWAIEPRISSLEAAAAAVVTATAPVATAAVLLAGGRDGFGQDVPVRGHAEYAAKANASARGSGRADCASGFVGMAFSTARAVESTHSKLEFCFLACTKSKKPKMFLSRCQKLKYTG